jgi:23S rRNA (adenine1618-N6)-methyltransferase
MLNLHNLLKCFILNIPQLLETKKMTPKTITEKTNLHPRNQHRFRYDFELLIKNSPELKSHVSINEHSIETIDFSDPGAKSLNQALLLAIIQKDIPTHYLCPPIPVVERTTFIT